MFPEERKRPGSEFSPALRRDCTFDYRVHLGCSRAESDDEALDHATRAATLDRDKVTADHAVANLWRRSWPGLNGGKSHRLDIRDQLRSDLRAELTALLELLLRGALGVPT